MGKREGKWIPFKDFYVNGASYGGLIGTSQAFVRYIQELLKSNCKLINEYYKKMLFSENSTCDGMPTGMCVVLPGLDHVLFLGLTCPEECECVCEMFQETCQLVFGRICRNKSCRQN